MSDNLTNFSFSKKSNRQETLRVDIRHGKLNANLQAYRYIDRDTKQVVYFIPSIEISGYGENDSKAEEMLRFSLADFAAHLLSQPREKIHTELASLGWKKGIFNKEYSKAYVDENGELQNLNAEENKVERLTLTAA